MTEAIFCITRFTKASLNQRLDSFLRRWAYHRNDARIPPGFDFDIRRQTRDVNEAFGVLDGLFVEGGNPGGKRIDKSVKVSIGQCPIHVAVELGQIASDVVRT